MPLINRLNDTKLKDLKWGNDRPGGGDSRQPYIKVDIRKLDSAGNQIRFARIDDGLIRGGAIGALQASLTDTIRIGKFLTDWPKGPLFIAKQVGLQLSNPKLETAGIPRLGGSSGLAKIIDNGIKFLNKNQIGPTRIYNLGINTLAQVPVGAFGMHIQRHGLTPIRDDRSNYEFIVKSKPTADNRLVSLSTKFFENTSSPKINSRLSNTINQIFSTFVPTLVKITPENQIIDDYIGGPNSTYGIGRTTIRRYTNTQDAIKLLDANQRIKARKITLSGTYGEDLDIKSPYGLSTEYEFPVSGSIKKAVNYGAETVIAKKFAKLQETIKKQIDNQQIPFVNEIAKSGPIVKVENGQAIGWTTRYQQNNIETRVGITKGTIDKINLTPLFESNQKPGAVKIGDVEIQWRDLVKFRIEAVDSDTPNKSIWMIFRAYLKNITDNHNPSHSTVKYIGRGENFYTYDNYTRQISFNFNVAALSAAEMEPMYQKMNFLASNTAPDYSSLNMVRSPLMRLTIGNYVYSELGFISSLTFNVGEDIPWEIALEEADGKGKLMYELPMVMDVNISFTMIHNFLPQKSVGDTPFILNKPAESKGSTSNAGTTSDAVGVENPWLKQKDNNGNYTNKPLEPKR